MKKIITITLLSFLTIFSASAQEGGSSMKGKYLLGAYTNVASVSWSDIALTPSVGYFLTDNIAIGLGFSYLSEDDNGDPSTPSGQSIDRALTLSPYVRYYLNDKLFLNAGFGIANESTVQNRNNLSPSNSITTRGFGLNVGAGLSLMWGERVAIEPEFFISSSSSSMKEKYGNTTTVTDMPSSFSAGFAIGLSLRL